MTCTKCLNKIGRKDPLCTLYIRASTGQNLTCTFCEKCFVEFTRFVAGTAPQEEPVSDSQTQAKPV